MADEKKPRIRLRLVLVSGIIILTAIAIVISIRRQAVTDTDLTTIRIGWQPPWINQGQITQVLTRTDILAKHGLHGELKPFTYGGPMVEAAAAGEIDVGFLGDFPATILISRDKRWKIVARMANYRSAFIVPTNSEIDSIQDLRGKNVGVAIGSTTYRETVKRLTQAGFEIDKDVFLKNVDQAEHAAIIQRGGGKDWGKLDAISTYDPTVGLGEEKGLSKTIDSYFTLSVVIMRDDFLQENREIAINFLKSYIEAFHYYVTHVSEADAWYAEAARLTLEPATFLVMASVEPNLEVKTISEINVSFSEDQISLLQSDADFSFELGLLTKRLDMQDSVDLTVLDEARGRL